MNDPWTWTMVWGLTVGVGSGLGRGGQRGKNWDNYKRITVKKLQIKFVAAKNTFSKLNNVLES